MLLEQIEAQLLRYPTFPLHLRAVGDRGLVVTAMCPWAVNVHVWRRCLGGPWSMSDGRATFRMVPELRQHSDVVEYLEAHAVRDVDGELERHVEEGRTGAFIAFVDLLACIILIQRLRAHLTGGQS